MTETYDRNLINYFPIGLRLKGQLVLIVGGGQPALTAITKLIDYGATVHVVAPHIISEIQELSLTHGGKVQIIKRSFGEEEENKIAQKEYSLIFALDNDAENNKIIELATKHKVLVTSKGTFTNTFKSPSFIVPAFRKRGRMNVSVSCDGLVHSVAKTMLERIEASLGNKFDRYVLFLEFVKDELNANPKQLKELADELDKSEELISALQRENFDEAMIIVENIISSLSSPETSTL